MNKRGSSAEGVREPGPTRVRAGSYLEDELLAEVMGPIPAIAFGVAMLVGAGVHHWFGWIPVVSAGVASLAGAVWFWLGRRRQRQALSKGHVAERQIGGALEEAITAESCAIAHNVIGVMDSGDIDHVVATRRSVWVIETKYRRVPKKEFPRVIARLQECRRRVEAMLPSDTPVRACLVLAFEGGGVKSDRDGVLVLNHDTLGEFLSGLRADRSPAESTPSIDPRVARTIWHLGRREVATTFEADEGRAEGTEEHHSNASAPPRPDEVRKSAPKAYGRWTPEDDRRLQELDKAGWSETDIATEFGRQPTAIRSRLRKLS